MNQKYSCYKICYLSIKLPAHRIKLAEATRSLARSSLSYILARKGGSYKAEQLSG